MKICSVENCSHAYYAKGFCKMHYTRQRVHGDPLVALTHSGRQRGLTCGVCGGPVWGRGLCRKHWKRWRRHGDPTAGNAGRGEHLRFLEQALKQESDACLPWPFGRQKAGYGAVTGRTASNLVCEMAHGPAPEEQPEAAHSCANPICVSPQHLRWASHAENMADTVRH